MMAQVLKSATARQSMIHKESNPVSAAVEVAASRAPETFEPVSVDIRHW